MGAFYAWLSSFPAWVFYGLGAAVVVEAAVLYGWSRRGKAARPVSWKYCAVMVLAGVVLAGFPAGAQFANSVHQRRVVDEALEKLTLQSKAEQDALIAQAQAYNRKLGPHEYAEIDDAATSAQSPSDEGYQRYLGLLNEGGSSFIGKLTIPAISVDLPIFHGTSPEVLEKGVGHVYHTALPVGGAGTHSALSAHAGLAGWRFFTDLDKLDIGDEWTVTVYQQEFTYRVVEKKVVLPHQVEVLAPMQGKDLMSLVTCTPAGINSHRVIVTAERVK